MTCIHFPVEIPSEVALFKTQMTRCQGKRIRKRVCYSMTQISSWDLQASFPTQSTVRTNHCGLSTR